MLNPSINRGPVSRSAMLSVALLTLVLVLPLAALESPVQTTTGKIAGGVYDSSGNPIPNATVLVWSEIDKSRRMTITNSAGVFDLDLPAGPYVLRVAAYDFVTSLPETITVAAGSSLQRTITLASGRGAQTAVIQQTTRIRNGGKAMAEKLVSRATPVYPAAAKAGGIEGAVILEALIGVDGVVQDLRVISGNPELARAAVDAVSQWRYQPILLNGAPVEVVTTVTVNFSLPK